MKTYAPSSDLEDGDKFHLNFTYAGDNGSLLPPVTLMVRGSNGLTQSFLRMSPAQLEQLALEVSAFQRELDDQKGNN